MLEKLDWFKLVIASLATYRLAILVSIDDGPLDVFDRIRRMPKVQAGYWQCIKNTEAEAPYMRMIAGYAFSFWKSACKFIECPYCTGVWMAALCLWLVMSSSIFGDIFLMLFAIAGLQAFMKSLETI